MFVVLRFPLYLLSEPSAVTLEELELPFDESRVATPRSLWMTPDDLPNGSFDRSDATAVRFQFGDHSEQKTRTQAKESMTPSRLPSPRMASQVPKTKGITSTRFNQTHLDPPFTGNSRVRQDNEASVVQR
jgi:hypothetical protein